MDQTGEWIPGHAPPDEGYWEALLRDGEIARAASAAAEENLWAGQGLDVQEDSSSPEPAPVVDWWEEARRAMEHEEVLELSVIGCNRGGVLVGWNGLRGFVPASHLLNLSPSAGDDERQGELRRLVGGRLSLKILELDSEQGRFVLSERATRTGEGRRQDLLNELSPGDVCWGHVTNLCAFGAFVDLGGLEGLVHISELSWGRVDHPGAVLEPGQPVEVYVLNVDRERGRVGLSVRRLQPDPWQSVGERYRVGQIVEGVVTHVVDFGAFVRVEDGLEGLVHVSELAEGNLLHPRDAIQEGDAVTCRVLNIDSQQRRMGLSLRQAAEPFSRTGAARRYELL